MAASPSDRGLQKIDQAADECQRLFVSKYQLKLRSKETIQRFLEEKNRRAGHG